MLCTPAWEQQGRFGPEGIKAHGRWPWKADRERMEGMLRRMEGGEGREKVAEVVARPAHSVVSGTESKIDAGKWAV